MNLKLLILPLLLQALVLTACEAGDETDGAGPAAEAPPAEASAARDAADASPAESPGADDAADASPAQLPGADDAADASRLEPQDADDAADARTSPGKPTAPITIDYEVIGTPVVGQPLSVNLNVKSSVSDRPVTLSYRINDASSLAFPEAQAQRVPLGAMQDAQHASQQVTVVPQREGRLYLNVSAEVETADGTLLKSIAVPIQVGTTPGVRQANGEVVRDADGDPIVSLPADDR